MKSAARVVVLSWPTPIGRIDAAAQPDDARSSWIQIAKTGSWESKRYGKFSITRTDLSTMLHNFTHITPEAPTQLPIDYDHLSMQPKVAGDGIAAGWMQKLELRAQGEELWAHVSWTPVAATRIANKEYQFISPSFVKDYVHKDGNQIGTTLLAAAVTNHPFLEGMDSITLTSDAVFGYLGLPTAQRVISLAEVGQAVTVKDDQTATPYTVAEVVGQGDDAFVALAGPDGARVGGWMRVGDLNPAPAPGTAQPAAAAPVAPVNPAGANPANPVAPVPGSPAAPAASAKPNPFAPHPAAAAPGAPGAPAPGAKPNPFAAKAAPGAAPGVKPGSPQPPAATDPHSPAGPTVPVPDPAHPAAPAPGAPGAAAPAGPVDPNCAAAHAHAASAHAQAASAHAHVINKGFSMSQTFTLSVNGADVEITAEQLAAAGITVVPEGAVAVPAADVETMRGQITNLSTQVGVLTADNEARTKSAVAMELSATLDRLSKGGKINKLTRDWAAKFFGTAIDLTAFREWASAQTAVILHLDTEHGSGLGQGAEPAAKSQLIELANARVKEQHISLSKAMVDISREHPELAEAYREASMVDTAA